ncbi:MAG: HK97 gp10 family phage protein [Candidatus Thioglobus sp.]
MSVTSFNLDLKEFAHKIDLEVEVVTRKIGIDAWTGVTRKTPVDTGRARANWNIGVGAIDSSTSDATSQPAPTLKKGDGVNALYITNNLPYIESLEKGDSTQSPLGMVEVTMTEIKGHINDIIRG